MSTGSPARRRNLDPEMNGISAYRYMLTDAMFRCGDALHDDARYAAEVLRLRRLAQPSIARHLAAWIERRDGIVGTTCAHCNGLGVVRDPAGAVVVPGFWVGMDGRPLQPGQAVPKEAYTGMEGAVMEIGHLDGIYWVLQKKKSETKSGYQKAVKSSRYAEEVDPEAAEDEDEG